MDDARLAATVDVARDMERELRETFDRAEEDQAERDSAQNALRMLVPYRKSLEGWIVRRQLRAQLANRTAVH